MSDAKIPDDMTLTENFDDVRKRLQRIEDKLGETATKTDIKEILDRLPPKP